MAKDIIFGEEARKALQAGVDKLADTVKARVMKMDGSGTYERIDRRGKELIDSQRQFCEEAAAQEIAEPDVRESRVFIPMESTQEGAGE